MDFAGYAEALAAYAQFFQMAQAGLMPAMFGLEAATPVAATPAAAPTGGKGKGFEGRPGDWNCPGCDDLQFGRNSSCRRCGTARPAPGSIPPPRATPPPASFKGGKGMRPGDWNCPRCGDHVFAKNDSCRRCGSGKPDEDGAAAAAFPIQIAGIYREAAPVGVKPGDWNCPACGDLQFARNMACRRCGAGNPLGAFMAAAAAFRPGPPQLELRPGDWICTQCNDHVFARNEACRRCSTPRPSGVELASQAAASSRGGDLKPGDWICSQCNDLQFARNSVCRRCNAPKPEEKGARSRSRSR